MASPAALSRSSSLSKKIETALSIRVSNQEMWLSSPSSSKRWTVLDIKSPETSSPSPVEVLDVVHSLGLEVVRSEDTAPVDETDEIPKAPGARRYILRRVPTSTLGYLRQQILALTAPEPPKVVTATNVQRDDELHTVLEDIMTCHICLEPINNCVMIQPCLHDFDSRCLCEWLLRNDKCPICRAQIKGLQPNRVLQKHLDEFNSRERNPHLDMDPIDPTNVEPAPSTATRSETIMLDNQAETAVPEPTTAPGPHDNDSQYGDLSSPADGPSGLNCHDCPVDGVIACKNALALLRAKRQQDSNGTMVRMSLNALEQRVQELLAAGQRVVIVGDSEEAINIRRMVEAHSGSMAPAAVPAPVSTWQHFVHLRHSRPVAALFSLLLLVGVVLLPLLFASSVFRRSTTSITSSSPSPSPIPAALANLARLF